MLLLLQYDHACRTAEPELSKVPAGVKQMTVSVQPLGGFGDKPLPGLPDTMDRSASVDIKVGWAARLLWRQALCPLTVEASPLSTGYNEWYFGNSFI